MSHQQRRQVLVSSVVSADIFGGRLVRLSRGGTSLSAAALDMYGGPRLPRSMSRLKRAPSAEIPRSFSWRGPALWSSDRPGPISEAALYKTSRLAASPSTFRLRVEAVRLEMLRVLTFYVKSLFHKKNVLFAADARRIRSAGTL